MAMNIYHRPESLDFDCECTGSTIHGENGQGEGSSYFYALS